MRYSKEKVRIGHKLAPSGRALRTKLTEMGYTGKSINWGHTKFDGVNTPEAIKLASHKRNALEVMISNQVPVPMYTRYFRDITSFPVIGRTSYHTQGSGFFFCNNKDEAFHATNNGATHFLQYIDGAREFRVHIVNGQSIKISEKHKSYDPQTGHFTEGSWSYPERFKRKITMRRIAKEAVQALGLDFGAVDMLYKKINGEPCFFVLEVNTAPCLTESREGDTLERYAEAFYANYSR